MFSKRISKISSTQIFAVQLTLHVLYPEQYPDTLPELSLESVDGDLEDDELTTLLGELRTVVRLQPSDHRLETYVVSRAKTISEWQ